MKIIFTILSFLKLNFQQELIIESIDTIVFKSRTNQFREVQLKINEKLEILNEKQGNIINISLNHADLQIFNVCSKQKKDIVFDDYQNRRLQLIDQNSNLDNFSQVNDISTSLNFVKINQGFLAVTSQKELILLKIYDDIQSKTGFSILIEQRRSYREYCKRNTSEIPQLVYSAFSSQSYLIFQYEILRIEVQDHQIRSIQNLNMDDFSNETNYLGNVRVYQDLMFFTLGSSGLDVYRIQQNGLLFFLQNFNSLVLYDRYQSLFIIDVAIGDNLIYVLDQHNGVSFINSTTLKTVKNMGSFFISGCFFLKQQNDEVLLILCQKGLINYIEEIGINGTNWFRMKRHQLNQKSYDIEFTKDFAIVRGVDSHRVIYHGIWQGFENAADESSNEYLYVPKLKQLIFHGMNAQFTKGLILGMTSTSIIEISWQEQQPGIFCETKDWNLVDQEITYRVEINRTDCQQKQDFLKNHEHIPKQLIMCQQIELIKLIIQSPLQNKFDLKTQTLILLLLMVTIGALIYFIYFIYRRSQLKKALSQYSENISEIN